MFGFELVTVVTLGVIVLTLFTSIALFASHEASVQPYDNAWFGVPIAGFFLVIEIIYLLVRFVKFVWFL